MPPRLIPQLLAVSCVLAGCSAPEIRREGLDIVVSLPVSERLGAEARAALEADMARRISSCADLSAYAFGFTPTLLVSFAPNGAVIGQPDILSIPSTPEEVSAVDGALHALRRCDPFIGGPMRGDHYAYWRRRVITFPSGSTAERPADPAS